MEGEGMTHTDLGTAVIEPLSTITAGSFVDLSFCYTAGHPIDESGYVKIVFRSSIDMGTPQFESPSAPNYCTVLTSGECTIEPRWDPKGHLRSYGRALYLKVTNGYLGRNEQILVRFGDTSHGSRGWQAPSACDDAFELRTFVDPIATYRFKQLSHSPQLRIVAGMPARALCIAPSQVNLDEPFHCSVKLEDKWGNPISTPSIWEHPGFTTAGWKTVTARNILTGLQPESNPINVCASDEGASRYWADFHGQTGETGGIRTAEEYFTFARDVGLLDICCHQPNAFQIPDDVWTTLNKLSQRFNHPGKFVTFPGYEWSGNTPLGGDRNVFYKTEGGAILRSSYELVPDETSAFPLAPTADDLFCALREDSIPPSFVFAHVGGRYANLAMHDEETEVAIEIHSSWGTFEWMIEDALMRGYRIGFCANSDGHKCRPGASYPGAKEFGSLGGLTCVLAESLDRQHIFKAMKARHFYATTGHRPILDVLLKTPDGRQAIMGDVLEPGALRATLAVQAVGTAPIERIDVFNGLENIRHYRPYTHEDLGQRLKITWQGAEIRGRNRRVLWNGSLNLAGNAITDIQPINFWDANNQPELKDESHVHWKSSTTGGNAGLIMTLRDQDRGTLHIKTTQGDVTYRLDEVGLDPLNWDFGGLGKQLIIQRLPDGNSPRSMSFELPMETLHEGDNPIYVRMSQEDGHIAWSSPIYIVNTKHPLDGE
jgi:Protein of unknown function (DUF3604)